MVSKVFDVIVIGVGGMGSAACCHLAQRGLRVLGLEKFGLVNDRGASHGESRIFRLSQFSGAPYVALARRAQALWREMGAFSTTGPIFTLTGGIDAGPEDGTIFPGALRSSQESGLDHQVLSAREAMTRFPALSLPDHYQCLYQKDAGILSPERGVAAHIAAARHYGADIRAHTPFRDIKLRQNDVTVTTDDGVYEAGHLVVCAGAWLGEILPSLKPVLKPERGVVGWFAPMRNSEYFEIGQLPIFIVDDGQESFYGFPRFGREGFKIGGNIHLREYGTAEGLRRAVDTADEERLRHFLQRFFPAGNGPMLSAGDCVWTLTPDEHFILDLHPDYPHVAIAGGCSGYGYKFCPVIGEVMADLVQEGETRHDIGFGRLARFNT